MHEHIVLLNDKTIIELDFAKYRDLSVSRRSIICLCLRHRQIIDLLATDKSRYFAQPRPIIVYYFLDAFKNAKRRCLFSYYLVKIKSDIYIVNIFINTKQ